MQQSLKRGQKAPLRLISSTIPRGAFFLIFATEETALPEARGRQSGADRGLVSLFEIAGYLEPRHIGFRLDCVHQVPIHGLSDSLVALRWVDKAVSD